MDSKCHIQNKGCFTVEGEDSPGASGAYRKLQTGRHTQLHDKLPSLAGVQAALLRAHLLTELAHLLQGEALIHLLQLEVLPAYNRSHGQPGQHRSTYICGPGQATRAQSKPGSPAGYTLIYVGATLHCRQ